MAQASSKRGMEKPPPTGGGATREKTEGQVLPKDFSYTLSGGKKVTVHKLTMKQVKELDLDFSAVRTEDGGINLAEIKRITFIAATDIVEAVTGFSADDVDSLPFDDCIGIAGKVLIAQIADNAAVQDFFGLVGLILSPAREMLDAQQRTTAS